MSKKTVLLLTIPAFLTASLLCGCRERPKLPDTHPVHGKVVQRDGRPVTSGRVSFTSQSDATYTTKGVIAEDGSFSVYSYKVGVRAQGAPAGVYIVSVIREGSEPIELPGTIEIKPGDNELKLQVK